MKIYTKTGDAGETGLFAGARVSKDHPRIEAYGTIDELNAFMGMARSHRLHVEIDALLEQIQHELFSLGAELATPDPVAAGTKLITERHVQRLETAIDTHEQHLPPLKQFILPGGNGASAALQVARGVCRRAERRVVTLCHVAEEPIASEVVRYLNRLGDLLFVLARVANSMDGASDIPWRKPE